MYGCDELVLVVLASSPGPILKLVGTKNRAWYPWTRSLCVCASHSPESGESCTVVILIFVCIPFRIPSRSQRKLFLVPDHRICTVSYFEFTTLARSLDQVLTFTIGTCRLATSRYFTYLPSLAEATMLTTYFVLRVS